MTTRNEGWILFQRLESKSLLLSVPEFTAHQLDGGVRREVVFRLVWCRDPVKLYSNVKNLALTAVLERRTGVDNAEADDREDERYAASFHLHQKHLRNLSKSAQTGSR